jgi:ribosomal protein S18 acetylase RimI-like enzyme
MENNRHSSASLSIRAAGPADAPGIVQLIRQMGTDSEITEDYVLYYLSGSERGVLLACLGESVTGLLSYSVRADLYHAGNSVLIEELVVDADVRGLGIGGRLLDALLEKLPGLRCKELCLAVMPDNEAAIRLYKRHGLVEEALFLERHFTGQTSLLQK